MSQAEIMRLIDNAKAGRKGYALVVSEPILPLAPIAPCLNIARQLLRPHGMKRTPK